VHDRDPESSGRIGRARHFLVAIPVDVRVVHAAERDVESAGGQLAALVVQVQPAGASMPSRSFSTAGRRVRLTARGCLLASGTAADSAGWRMQVVGAENEDAGPVEQWSEGVKKAPDRLGCAMLSRC